MTSNGIDPNNILPGNIQNFYCPPSDANNNYKLVNQTQSTVKTTNINSDNNTMIIKSGVDTNDNAFSGIIETGGYLSKSKKQIQYNKEKSMLNQSRRSTQISNKKTRDTKHNRFLSEFESFANRTNDEQFNSIKKNPSNRNNTSKKNTIKKSESKSNNKYSEKKQ